jgi:hypothetical protein
MFHKLVLTKRCLVIGFRPIYKLGSVNEIGSCLISPFNNTKVIFNFAGEGGKKIKDYGIPILL